MGALSRILRVGSTFVLALVSGMACPEPIWLEGYKCEVSGTCTCKNNESFIDAYGYACIEWSDNCISAVEDFWYEPHEQADVIRNCPKACGLCYCEDWGFCFSEESDIIKNTKHFRDLRDKSACPKADAGCLEPTWRTGYTCEVEGTCTCTDNASFADKDGHGCSWWWDRDCIGAHGLPLYGISLEEERAIIGNCPKACGACNCENCTSIITACAKGWFFADLINALFTIFLEEILGYSVQWERVESCDYSLEVWAEDLWYYHSGTNLNAAGLETFDLGYHGGRGVYYSGVRYESCYQHNPNCTDKCNLSDIAAGQCANRSDVFENFVSHFTPKARKHFPESGYYDILWEHIDDDKFVPEHCLSGGSETCMELLSYLYYGYEKPLHNLISTTFFPYHVRQVGDSRTREGVRHRISSGKGAVFTYWEPDPFLVLTKAIKIAFPFELSSCHDSEEGFGHTIGCTRPVFEIKNVVRDSLHNKGPEVYYALRNAFRVSEVDLADMMATHVLAGGEFDNLKQVSCFWMKQNQDNVQTWLPPCAPGTSPYILANKSLKCCNGTLFRHLSGIMGCKPACNLTDQVPDAISGNCWPRCSTGSVLDRATSMCKSCPEGMVWTRVSDNFFTGVVAECQCSAGFFLEIRQAETVAGISQNTASGINCKRCPLGRYQDELGRTACIACSKGFFADVIGLTECLHCPVGKYVGSVGSSGCYQCPPMHTSKFEGSMTLEDCKCKAGYYFDSSMGECSSCGLLHTTADVGAESSDECAMTADVKTAIGCGAGGLVGLLLVLAVFFQYYRITQRKQIKALKETQREHYNRIIGKAYTCMKSLEHPMVLVSAAHFLDLGCLVSYEILRDQGKLVFLDSLDRVTEFKETSYIIFLSHQWLGWGKPDPENVQYDTMSIAIRNIFQHYRAAEDAQFKNWYVWCDFTSVPQFMRNLQILAIRSLPIYACVADAFVIIAPTCKHSDSGEVCNLDTYMSRGWCRTEILSKLCGTGMQNMYIVHNSCGKIQAVTHEFWGTLDFRVFHGNFSCCRLCHAGSERCDKEDLVPTVLGLYALVLAQQDRQDMCHVLQHINLCKMECFPRRFTFVAADGGEEERELFGPLITLLEKQIAKQQDLSRISLLSNEATYSMTALLTSAESNLSNLECATRKTDAGEVSYTEAFDIPHRGITPDPPADMVLGSFSL